MNRIDIHAPSRIQPDDYQFVCIISKVHGLGDALCNKEERKILQRHMDETEGRFSQHEHGGTCHVCGAHALYLATFYHEKTNEYIQVGHQCCDKLEMGVDARLFNKAKSRVKDARDYIAGKTKAENLLKKAGLSKTWMMYNDTRCTWAQDKVRSIIENVIKYGRLTDPQIGFLKKLSVWDVEQRDKDRADVPTGRVKVTGTVVKTKTVPSCFHRGDVIKMTVEDQSGFLVYGTMPSAFNRNDDLYKGSQVEFHAKLTPSYNDRKFGFFSRPTKARLIKEADHA